MGPQGRALERAAALLGLAVDELPLRDGYVDLVAEEQPAPTGFAQRLMGTSVVPAIYERWWRPALGRVAKGPSGPSMEGEVRLARELLSLAPGDTVLDVACGPGNLTRPFAEDVGVDGAAVGLDVSRTMLARAVRDTRAPQVVYVRGDITELSLQPSSVDAVCCFAALHLFADPGAALDAMAGALVDGGRLALLTSARPDGLVAGPAAALAGRVSGMEVFEPGAMAEELRRRGLQVDEQRIFGVVQLLGAHRPASG